MTIAEAEKFYKQDNHLYELNKNKDFLQWLKNIEKQGYTCPINLDDMQDLINYLVNWYEIKYPNKDLEGVCQTEYIYDNKPNSISDMMNTKQLLYRLNCSQASLLECNLRWNSWMKEEDGIYLSLSIEDNQADDYFKKFSLFVHNKTGKVIPTYELSRYLDDSMNLDELYLNDILTLFDEKYADRLDYSEVIECICNYQCDLELRNMLIELSALKMLYSKKTIPEKGYTRASIMIDEMNNDFNLNISKDTIDQLYYYDYKNGGKWQKNIRKTTDNEEYEVEEFSYDEPVILKKK